MAFSRRAIAAQRARRARLAATEATDVTGGAASAAPTLDDPDATGSISRVSWRNGSAQVANAVDPFTAAAAVHRPRPRPAVVTAAATALPPGAAASYLELEAKLKLLSGMYATLSKEVEVLRGHTNSFYGTCAVENLSLYTVVPVTRGDMRDLIDGSLEKGKRYKLSYPQQVGSNGLIFMTVHLVDPQTGALWQRWVPVGITSETIMTEVRDTLGVEAETYFEPDFATV
jgi:hypothetical protein